MLDAVVVVVPALAAVLFSRVFLEVFNTTKLLVVVVGALFAGGAVVVAALRGHRLTVPRQPVWAAVAVFLVVAAAATAGSPSPWRSFVGASNASAGLALYAACAMLAVAAASAAARRQTDRVVRVLLVAAVPVIVYGVVQVAGADPLRWRSTSGGPPVFSTFGNANFMSGWLGVVTVLAVWSATASAWTRPWRVFAAGVAVAALTVATASASIQGPIGAVTGCAVLAAAWLTDHGRHRARRRLLRTAAILALPLAVVATSAAMLLARGGAAQSFATRTGKWQAAAAMGFDRPLTGVGLDLFVDWYHLYRPISDAATRGVARTADAAHSVPLQLFAGGGVPLLVAYVLFVAAVGGTLLRAVRSAHGHHRLAVGALGGAWAAYLVQSLVSMDVPPLALLGWLLSGMIVGLAEPSRAPQFSTCRHRPWSQPAALAAAAAAGAVLLLVAIPVRADVAARRAIGLTADDRHAEAEDALRRALELNPWEPQYAVQLARLRASRGDHAQALQAYRLAATRQPRGIAQAVETPRVAHLAGDHQAASAGYDAALALDPRSPDLLLEAGRHHLRWGERERGAQLLERAAGIGGRSGRRAARVLARTSTD